MASLKYWLWLASREKVGKTRLMAALNWFGDPELVYKADEKSLKYVEGIRPSDITAFMDKNTDEVDKILDTCADKNISIVTFQDAGYPTLLKSIDDPPFALYVLGKLPDMDNEIPIAVVGSRKASLYGQISAKRLGYQISRCGGLVVSGMAQGIDSMAQTGALLGDSRTVAVLGGGVDVIYPKSSRYLYGDIVARGAVISEYPPGTAPKADHFPVRNRIISGMCYGTVVVECPEKSGSLITANRALEQGRDVFAVPGKIDNDACRGSNKLIQDGAILVSCGWDVMREYTHLASGKAKFQADAVDITAENGIRKTEKTEEKADNKPKKKVPSPKIEKKVIDKEPDKIYIQPIEELGPDAKAIVEALGDRTLHVDDIIELTQMKAARVLATLTLLEIKGIVKQSAGKRFKLNMER